MSQAKVLITGCAGEIGHSLIDLLVASSPQQKIVALDMRKPEYSVPPNAEVEFVQMDITSAPAIAELGEQHEFERIFHLAAILSTGGERNPLRAHEVNVGGSVNLLNLARSQSEKRGSPLTFVFPSTIAIYGLPSESIKVTSGEIVEDQFLSPITMYGMNKLYIENLGRYFQSYYKFLDTDAASGRIDFRSVRLPGIISAFTEPTGGTSDYGPEMLYAAAKGVPYNCFVEPGARLPFMTMPDALRAITSIASAPREKLTRSIYNVTAFSLSADEIRQEVLKYFPKAEIGYAIHEKRNAIVSSWPGAVDDSAARKDWGWEPKFTKDRAFEEYLVPAIRSRYENQKNEFLKCGNG